MKKRNHQPKSQRCGNLKSLFREAARALGITEGEFWVWYGSPVILLASQEIWNRKENRSNGNG